ncbi:HAD-superfamily hydrolase [Halodesulfurarchaeum formicicum]|uniref:HAD-superfamily hydrolase n=1 Tax=Halodesulfurarchaeum formicicum TaxID=1873524 RepID=A0A1D8S3J2_9EURY|nr:HAD family phosphatase [Halodesulfurarchaeum formicicum]AOW79927.1 HAD-superfamily hydrolase [Halodesulfurarchaeum formicicum]APE95220.1 HAD-superfamily hydrolase [Halodesulfurarchaeum formicicum]
MTCAVVFDMDGVIVDTEQYWIEAEREILDTALPAGHDVDPLDITGINVHDQYDLLAEEYDLQVSQEAYFDLFDREAEGVYERADLLAGFHDLLDAIRARSVPIGLATSSYPRWIDIVFESHDLDGRFDQVLSAANLDGPGKPAPLIYETIAERLDREPTDLIVVEDSENGIAAAASAGAYTVAYAAHGTDDGTDRSPADEVVETPTGLEERVLALLDGE